MAQDNILQLLRTKNEWLRSTQISQEIGISHAATKKNLRQMTKYKDIKRTKSVGNSFLYHW